MNDQVKTTLLCEHISKVLKFQNATEKQALSALLAVTMTVCKEMKLSNHDFRKMMQDTVHHYRETDI